MKNTIEIYVMIALITIIALMSTSYLTSSLYAASARDFHSSCIQEIQSSNFSNQVINRLKNEAKSIYGDGDTECLMVEYVDMNGRQLGKVTLTYSYKLKLLNFRKNFSISGYAT